MATPAYTKPSANFHHVRGRYHVLCGGAGRTSLSATGNANALIATAGSGDARLSVTGRRTC